MPDDALMLLSRIVLGAIIGFCIGLTGIGGGVLVLPTLTLVVGLPPSVAVGTANLYAFLCKLSAVYHHARQKSVDFTTSVWFMVGALPANILVSVLVNHYVNSLDGETEALKAFQHNLQRFMAAVVVVSALLLFVRILKSRKEAREADTSESMTPGAFGGKLRVAAILSGTLVGGLIGATSIGGGVVIVPILILVFGLTPARTVGTSILVAVVLTFFSALVYGVGGQTDWMTGIVMAGGSLLGVPLGSRLAVKMRPARLQAIVAVIVLVAGALMFGGKGE